MRKVLKRAICGILTVALVLALVPNLGEVKSVEAANTAEEVVNIAISQEGYIEKASNALLDDKTANAGRKNFTKYHRDLNIGFKGTGEQAAWCAYFVRWVLQSAGVPSSEYPTSGYVPTWQEFYKNKGRYHARGTYIAKPGDLVIIRTSEGPRGHIGIVVLADNTGFYYTSGNTGNYTDRVARSGWMSQNDSKVTGWCEMSYNSDSTPPVISNIRITDVTMDRYTVECDVTDNVGVTSVRFPSWPGYTTSDGCEWYEPASVNGNHYSFTLRTEGFNYYSGQYVTHIYAYDAAGNYSGVDARVPAIPQSYFNAYSTTLNGHRYELYTGNCSWNDAKTFAEQLGGHLVTINSEEENTVIKNIVKNGTNDAYWMGATDEGSEGTFRWVTGESFNNYGPGGFDNAGGSENYLGMWNGCWNDFPGNYCASGRIGYIVEYEPEVTEASGTLNGHEYIVYKDSLTATEARSKEGNGYHLATITSQAEHDFIMGLTKQISVDPGGYWLGANDNKYEGHFQWETGEPFDFNLFPTGQPDNKDATTGEAENYFGVWSSGTWNDFKESTRLGYVLEKDPPVSTASGTFNDHEYYVSAEYLTRAEAEALQTDGWYLATITSSEEKDYLVGVISGLNEKNLNGYWLGGNDVASEGTFVWENGEVFSYSNWGAYQPSNNNRFGQNENYLSIWDNGEFNDSNENYCLGYILEKNPEPSVVEMESIEITSDRDTSRNVYEGDTFKLTAAVSPSNATNQSVVWSSSNEEYATVDEEGNVEVKSTDIKNRVYVDIQATSETDNVKNTYRFNVYPKSGYCNSTKTVMYDIDYETGVVRIYGEGAMAAEEMFWPWAENDDLNKIVIEDGVTSTDAMLCFNSNIREVTFADSVEFIKDLEFDNNYNVSYITSLVLPANLKTIYNNTFSTYAGSLQDIYFKSNAPSVFNNGEIEVDKNATLHVPSDAIGFENWPGTILYDQPAIGNVCEHTWNAGETTTAPTCTENGEKTFTCTKCGETKTESIDKLGHDYGEYISNNDATCVDDGTETATCSRCKTTTTRTVKGSATGVHDWGEYEVTTEPTCTSVGVKTRTCKTCGKKSTLGISVLEHEYVEEIQKEASCTEMGIRKLTCKHCEDEKYEPIEKKAHTIVTDSRVEPTTTSTGLTEGKHCSVCNTVIKKQEIIPKLEDSNCTVYVDLNGGISNLSDEAIEYNGLVSYSFTVSSGTYMKDIEKYVQGNGPYWFGSGVKFFRGWKVNDGGSIYGYNNNYYVEKINDIKNLSIYTDTNLKAEWYDAVHLTFDTGEGYYEDPSGEKAYTNDDWVIKGYKLNFTYDGPENDNPDRAFVGWKDKKTGVLYASLDSFVPQTDVDFVATWEDKEIEEHDCNKDGHVWGDGVTTKAASCSEKGIMKYTCTICGETKTEDIETKAHTPVIDSAVAATTTKTGLTEGSHCSVCNKVLKAQEVVPKLKEEKPSTDKPSTPKYSNEWVDGKWYDINGNQTYTGTLQWKSNGTGLWVEDTDGWYPIDSWQKIDGKWYFFKPDGYAASSEYYKGYWFNKDGTWDPQYKLSWKSNSTGWWVEDISGWWPSNSWLKIDGCWYYFDGSGYMVTSQYVDGWWIDADGVCR